MEIQSFNPNNNNIVFGPKPIVTVVRTNALPPEGGILIVSTTPTQDSFTKQGDTNDQSNNRTKKSS